MRSAFGPFLTTTLIDASPMLLGILASVRCQYNCGRIKISPKWSFGTRRAEKRSAFRRMPTSIPVENLPVTSDTSRTSFTTT
jgi:hypothetical protein